MEVDRFQSADVAREVITVLFSNLKQLLGHYSWILNTQQNCVLRKYVLSSS